MSVDATHCVRNLSLGKKIAAAIVIFVLPIALMGFFLINEKNDLIDFTKQEIAGVTYLHAVQTTVNALTSQDPAAEAGRAIAALKDAEKNDAGALNVTAKAQAVLAALEDVAKGTKSAGDVLGGPVSDLNAAVSDNSNITLDPDMDAYYVGDIIVNQATGVLTQVSALVGAAHDLDGDKVKTDDHKIAFAEARDGAATSAGNFASDLGKAIKGNTDGLLQGALAEDGKAVAAAVDKLADAVKGDDRTALNTAANNVLKTVKAFTAKGDNEMDRLLRARIDGFHTVVFNRLGLAFLFVLLGGVISWFLVNSISKPLGFITTSMSRLTAGDLNIEIPQEDRSDEIGKLLVALRAFHTATVERERALADEQRRLEEDQVRAQSIKELNATFNNSVRTALSHLSTSVGQLNGTANKMASDSDSASKQASTVAAAAEQASANVQTVASASEELSASIREIANHIETSTNVAKQAAQDAKQTRVTVGTLSQATGKIGDVVSLINQIAGQTNLLALNATIEAARAGEAGKGFAVVASEVKTLANQTARATEDITNHIGAIQDSVKNVITAIEHIDLTIGQINEISSTIAGAIEQQREATQEISRNVQEAAQGTHEVTTNITRIAEKIAAAGHTSQEVLGSTKSVEEQSQKLSEDVGAYLSQIQSLA